MVSEVNGSSSDWLRRSSFHLGDAQLDTFSEDCKADEWTQNTSRRWKCHSAIDEWYEHYYINVLLFSTSENRDTPWKYLQKMETVATGMAGLWRGHRIGKQNKPPSRSHVYHLYWQGGSRSPQWPSVSKRWRQSRHQQSAGVMGKAFLGKQTSCTGDMNSIIARRNSQNQSTLTSLRLERSPKLARLETWKMILSAI